jgi:hypothetical protein
MGTATFFKAISPADSVKDLFNFLQHTKDTAGIIDCDGHMKHQVSVWI